MSIGCIDAEMITRDITNCSSSRAMATVGADHDAELWRLSDAPGSLENQPIALNKRAKVTPNSRLAKRIDPAHMEAMWLSLQWWRKAGWIQYFRLYTAVLCFPVLDGR